MVCFTHLQQIITSDRNTKLVVNLHCEDLSEDLSDSLQLWR